MGKRRPLTPEELDRIATMREAGATNVGIAAAIGCSIGSVQWACLRLGADPPHPKPLRLDQHVKCPTVKRGNHVVRAFTPDDDARLLDLERQGLGDTAIGRLIGRKPNSVRGRLMTLARRDERAHATSGELA
jgi:hypothetical protein